jgi:putative endopeptidase
MGAHSQTAIHELIEDDLVHPSSTAGAEKVAAFYKAYMNEERVERLGTEPLKADLARVREVKTKVEMSGLMGAATKGFGDSILGVYAVPDARDTTHYMVELYQSGLGLPGRDFYIKPEFATQKAKYQVYVATMLRLASWPDAEKQAAAVVEFESSLAKASWTEQDRRDPQKTYHPVDRIGLSKAAAGFDMNAFLDAAGVGHETRFNARENTAIPHLAKAFSDTTLETLKAWEAFRIIDQAADLLPRRFVQTRFEFRGQVLSGQQEIAPRWKRALDAEDDALGEAVGRLYVARYFSAVSKAQMEQLVANLKAAFRDRIVRANWMSETTKAEALHKLDMMSVGIGYPSKWKLYEFEVSPTDLYGNVGRALAWHQQDVLARLHQPVNREAWQLLPQSSGSEYDPSINRMTFPAANLQPPFFDPNADSAVNYGAIGVVIGHELTHGFDDQGRKTDSTGLLRDWWTNEDAEKFDAKADRLSKQYSAFEPLPGMHVDGQLTLGEDMADTGGMAIALDAYHRSLDGGAAPILDGTTGDQRFFLSCAQVWAGKTRDDSIRRQLTNNPHPPGQERVNGEVRNLDEWYAAFSVKPGDKLYIAPENRVHVW